MFFYEKEHSDSDRYLYHQFDSNLSFPLHMHNSFEFIYVENGELTLKLSNNEYTIKAGMSALILPNQLHSYTTKNDSYSYLCIFSLDYIYDFYKLISDKVSDYPLFVLDDITLIARITNKYNSVFEEKAVFYSIVAEFVQKCTLKPKESSEDKALSQMISYIQYHFTEEISLKTISDNIGYHYNYLSSLLNKQLDLSFSELVNRYRIELASELLTTTDLSITEISQRCGFNTIRSFNRNFLLFRKITPHQFRQLNATAQDTKQIKTVK